MQLLEYRRYAVGGDRPELTRVSLWFLLRPGQELRSPLTELPPGPEAWIWSPEDSLPLSQRTSAFDNQTRGGILIFPVSGVLRVPNPSQDASVVRARAKYS
jgi:hypothetical protein